MRERISARGLKRQLKGPSAASAQQRPRADFFSHCGPEEALNKNISCTTENVLKKSDVLGFSNSAIEQDPTTRLLTSDVYVDEKESLACKLICLQKWA